MQNTKNLRCITQTKKATPKLIPSSHFLQMKNILSFQLKLVFFCQRIANLTAREQMYFLHEETLVLFCAPKNQHENFCNIVYTPNKMPAMAPFRSSFTVKRKISHGNYFSVCEVNIEQNVQIESRLIYSSLIFISRQKKIFSIFLHAFFAKYRRGLEFPSHKFYPQ